MCKIMHCTCTYAVPPTALSVSIEATGDTIAGEIYTIECIASLSDGIQSTPFFTWLDSNNSTVVNNNNIVVGPPTASSLPLVFQVLTVSLSGQYTCQATLYSLALERPLIVSTSIHLDVQSKSLINFDGFDLKFNTEFTATQLNVTVISIPAGPHIDAAEFLILQCLASGGTGVYSYQWLSNCTGNCFLNGQTSQMVTRDALRSTDSGTHICVVRDGTGNNGSDSTVIEVTGGFTN